jgi:hypothetical protein
MASTTLSTLHGPDGERLVGFDNAHPVSKQKRGEPQDHLHRLRTVRAYEYLDAATYSLISRRRWMRCSARRE